MGYAEGEEGEMKILVTAFLGLSFLNTLYFSIQLFRGDYPRIEESSKGWDATRLVENVIIMAIATYLLRG